MSFHDIEIEVIRWAEATKQLYAIPKVQVAYTVETVYELRDSIFSLQPAEIHDAMGRVVIDLILLAAILDADLSKCLEQAFARVSAKPEKSNVVFLKQE